MSRLARIPDASMQVDATSFPGRARALAAEAFGACLLLAAIVGSGIMAERLSGGNVALALLCNTLATGAALLALLLALGPISGAHLNPLVTLASAVQGALPWSAVPGEVIAQVAGAVSGALLANAMFGLPLVSLSTHVRAGGGQWLSEAVATFGLLTVITLCARQKPDRTPVAVSAYIVAAYWFTASTSFANPAVTVARSLSDTFAGIRPGDVPGFLAAQVVGAALAVLVCRFLLPPPRVPSPSP